MAYIGVGERKMCSACGVEVMNQDRHDLFHAEFDRLIKRLAELENANTDNLVTV